MLDKDAVRAALFGPDHVAYSRDQDDHCVAATYRAAAWVAATGAARAAVLDGRCYARREQVAALRAFAWEAGLRLALVECTCAPDVARARLLADAEAHPAADRGPALYDRLAAAREPLEAPDLVLRTDEAGPSEHVAACLNLLGVSC